MSDALTSAPSEPEWAAFAAIDWADKKNFWRLLPTGARRSEEGELENSPDAVEAWAVLTGHDRVSLNNIARTFAPGQSENWKLESSDRYTGRLTLFLVL
jgi:hypothetical protein